METHRTSARYEMLHSQTDVGEYRGAGDMELNEYGGSSGCPHVDNINDSKTGSKCKETTADEFLIGDSHDESATHSSNLGWSSGWRPGVLISFVGAICVFILNLSISLWVWKNPDYEVEGAIGTLLQGSCSRVRRLNIWIHLIVNVLSTLLLCGSNYVMQILSAPNRVELDRAHASRQWLHIGVPGLHNLTRISRGRCVLWLLLVLSSFPLHLLFNSVIFTNLQANNYIVVPTMEDWLFGTDYNTSGLIDYDRFFLKSWVLPDIEEHRPLLNDTVTFRDGSVAPRYLNTSTAECFDLYNTQYASAFGNVYLIQSEPAIFRYQSKYWAGWHLGVNGSGAFEWFNNTIPDGYEYRDANVSFPYISKPIAYPSNGWRCKSHRNETCNVKDENEVPRDRSKWEPYERPVNYCMVEQVPEICKLQFSFLIAIIVIISNLVKAGVIGWVLFKYKAHKALVTLGDAIANFLEHPDLTTRGRCLQSNRQIQPFFNARTFGKPTPSPKDAADPQPQPFKLERHRWSKAPSYGRWFATYMFYSILMLLGILAMAWSLDKPFSLSEMGFGTVTGVNLLSTSTTLMGSVLLANSPQVVLSYLYFAFNALYTNMFVAREWATFAHERKALRTTAPRGQQRNTYFLTVPFRYAVPMAVVSGTFHWLVSQSLFMVRITVTESRTRKIASEESISTCGYSPLAIILTFVVAAVIAFAGIAMGRLKYPAGMPLASSCSAAISAACHPPVEDVDAHLLPVQWGVVAYEDRAGDSGEGVGHCSFSSLPVEQPVPGRLYA